VVFRVEGNRAVLARTPDFLDLARTVRAPAAKAQRGLGRGDPAYEVRSGRSATARATAYLERELLLTDLVAAETVYVLESFYEVPRDDVAQALPSLVAFESIVCVGPALLLRAVEVYKTERIDFAEAFLVAGAESTDVGTIVSLDRSIDRVDTVERVEPPRL